MKASVQLEEAAGSVPPAVLDLEVHALDPTLAEEVRRTRRDGFGNCVELRNDASPHQCRVCLRLTEPHENYLLLSHSPFGQGARPGGEQTPSPYAERGPIFIHERDCVRHPEGAGFPREFPRSIVLRAYDRDGAIHDARLTGEHDLEQVARRLLADPGVSFVHARNAAYGCFMYEIRRRST